VFEPNGPRLWANIRQTVEDFLLVLWRDGALLGDKPEQAYFVRCDRTTMTQNDLDNGRLICLIGVAPVKPAENEPGRAGSGRFYVHLGIYAATKNADDLVATLKKGGFPAFAEASDYQGKPAERVRVGPYEDRAAAEAARLRIKQVKPDVPGSVVQLAGDVTAEAPAPTLPANRAGGYAVQLGAFKTVEEANKVRDRLKGAGFAAYVDKVAADSGTLWRVRAGPEADRGNADKLRGRIKDKLKLDGMVVTQQ